LTKIAAKPLIWCHAYTCVPVRSLRQAGNALRALRAVCKVSQKQLGEVTGTAQSTISDIENGAVSVSLDVYLRLIEALGTELSVTDRLGARNLRKMVRIASELAPTHARARPALGMIGLGSTT
jgi:transcriptional regulator with XRE-family HTH domain